MSIGNKIHGLKQVIKGKLVRFNEITDGTIQVTDSLKERTQLLNDIINIDNQINILSQDYQKPKQSIKIPKIKQEEYRPINLNKKLNQMRIDAIKSNDWDTTKLLTKKIKKLRKNAAK